MTPPKSHLSVDFSYLMVTRALFTFGAQMQSVVLGWQMYSLTHSALYLGMIGLAEAIPAIGLALYAGLIVDRGDPQKIYRGVLLFGLLSAAIMTVACLNTPSHDLRVILLFAAAFVAGISRSFGQPSIYSLVPKLTSPQNVQQATAWMSSTMQTARVAGPAAGGIICGFVGNLSATLTIVVVLMLSLMFSLRPMSISTRNAVDPNAEPRLKAMLMGLQYVLAHPILLPALTLDMISVLFAGVTALLPIYADTILNVGSEGLGILRAAPSIGAVLIGLVLTQVDIRKRAGALMLYSVAGFGVSILVFAVSQSFLLSASMLALSGIFDGISVVIRSSAVQLFSPESMRGRISAVNSMFIGSSNELGEVESGVLAHLFGTVPTAIFGGVVCLVTVGILGVRTKALRALDLTRVG